MALATLTRLDGRAMGVTCSATVIGPGGFDLARRALGRVGDLERLWTRFSPTSELNRMNAAAGRPVFVSTDTARLVAMMLAAHEATAGLFDPTLLPVQLAAGDNTSLVDGGTSSLPVGACSHDIGAVRILDANTVQLPAGLAIDAGGIGKGLAADIVARETIDAGAAGVCVNIGGDLACLGEPPAGGWTVTVSHPHLPDRTVATLSIAQGAVATSSVSARNRGPRPVPVHVVDPRTRRLHDGAVHGATVVASSAAWAEAFTKFALLSPSAPDTLSSHGVACMTVSHDGAMTTNPEWQGFVP